MSAKEEGNVPPTEDVKKEGDEQINLKVQNSQGGEVFFKIKRSTPLRKLMEAYASRSGVSLNSIRFLYDGQRLNSDSTPKELNMENDDAIDVVLQQTGGSFSI
ncbi:hypothetical protein CYY_005013 [Polysphondylium violaceum]|uniref:Ubiquitin-like domain-containing protein n=1 Tax=Polysphondylium violaceum TaxID=133409 RepID=A0A8J4UZY0_9MYCE|nr:hypothetical protein CYY_005013 [Polysphondylium violaceum]